MADLESGGISPLGIGAINAGAGTLSALADKIFNSKDPERIKRLIAYLRSQMGQDAISGQRQRDLSHQIFQTGARDRNRDAERVGKRLGIDSGLVQQDILGRAQHDRFKGASDIALLNERLTAGRRDSLTGTIAGLEGALFNG